MTLTEELRCKLEDDLHVYVICDRLSKDDVENILDNFDKWVKTADWGDCYTYGLENNSTYMAKNITTLENSSEFEINGIKGKRKNTARHQ